MRRALIAVAALTLLVSGCGSSGADEVEVDRDATLGVELADTEWQTDDVNRDAEITVGTTMSLVSADTHAAGVQVSTAFFNLIYDRLFWVTANSELRGYLVDEWDFTEEGLQLTLRDDAAFHDGSPIDAEAVKANLDRARTIETSAWIKALAPIEAVDVIDGSTLLLRTKAKTGATLPYVLAGWAGMVMNPKFFEDQEALKTTVPDGIGSGPYRVTSWTPGEANVELARAEGHWDEAAGQVAKITLKTTPDPTQLVNAIATGQYDVSRMANDWAITAIDRAKADPEKLQTGELMASNAIVGVWMRDLVEPTVREAIGLALDRDALLAQYRGGAEAVNQFFGEDNPAYSEAVAEYTTSDPARAEELVAKAPADSTRLTMAYLESGLESRVAQLIQSQLKEVGIEVTLKPTTYASVYPDWYAGKFDMVLMGNAGMPHASIAVDASLLRGGVSWGAPDSAVEELGALLTKADDPALADDARNQIYQDIFTRVAKERWVLPFARLRSVTFGSKQMVNMAPAVPFQYQMMEDLRYVAVKAE